jgi:hypothetical protein
MEFWVSRFCAVGDARDCGRFDVSRRAIGATRVFDWSLMNRPADRHRALCRTPRLPQRAAWRRGRERKARQSRLGKCGLGVVFQAPKLLMTPTAQHDRAAYSRPE